LRAQRLRGDRRVTLFASCTPVLVLGGPSRASIPSVTTANNSADRSVLTANAVNPTVLMVARPSSTDVLSVYVPARLRGVAEAMFPSAMKPARALLLILATGADVGALGLPARAHGQPSAEPARVAQTRPASAECPKGKQRLLDLHGDPLPEGAVARLGTVRMRHGHLLSGLVFSGDGKSIIASDYYSGVHVWDAAEGSELRRFCESDYYCHCLAISPDGRTLAVAHGNLTVRLFDPGSGREIGSLPKDRDRLNSMVFSNDGTLLATAAGGNSVRIYNVASRELVHRVNLPDYVGHIAFSSDGKILAGGTKKGVSLWDLAQGKEVGRLKNEPDSQHSLYATLAPGGGSLAVWGYEDASIRLFDANGLKEIRRFNPEGAAITKSVDSWGWANNISVSFSPNGKVLAVAREVGRIDLWDVKSGKKLHTLACDSFQRPTFLAFSRDGTKLASAGSDNWGGDNTVRLWDITEGKEVRPLAGHGSPISSVAISPNGNTIATGGRDGAIHLWEGSSGKHLSRLEGHRNRRSQVSFSTDGQRLVSWGSWGSDGRLRIWDSRTWQVVSRLELQGPDAYWEAVSGDGKTAVSGDLKKRSVRFHDLTTGKVTGEADDSYRPIALSPTGDKLVGLDGALITVADRKEVFRIPGVYPSNTSVRFNADGRVLIAAAIPERAHKFYTSDPPAEEVAVVDPIAGKELRRFGKTDEQRRSIDAVALSRDGKTVVTVRASGDKPDEQLITLWETETGRERGHFLGHRGRTHGVAISADGRFVVSGGEDTSGLVWDATGPRRRDSSIRHESVTPDLAARFKDLAGDNAEQAYASIRAFINAPKETVSFLGGRSDLFAATDVQTIQGWIRDLDSNRFAERERASQELGLILDEAEGHLKTARQSKPSAETQRRIDLLLQAKTTGFTGKKLQRFRVIEILEHIAGPGAAAGPDTARLAAVALLKEFAARPPEARMTREARVSLERLERRVELKR
jgi:WD40 repeat protein